MSISLVAFGTLIYIGVPQAFFNENYYMFFLLMMLILLAMTLGIVFLFQFFQIIMEKILLVVFMATMCRYDKRLKGLLSMNLESHRRRNSKTALMFTFCLCFIMYGGCSFKLMSDLIITMVR